MTEPPRLRPDEDRLTSVFTRLSVANIHDYLSTACYHHMHSQCRKVCKFCPAPCRCHCHDEPA